jgi:methionyl-tRNA formyltransferase
LRIVFFGTPDFAVPTLEAVATAHEVMLVVAQPDKPAGRGMRVQPPAIAVRARSLGLSLAQPAKIRTPEFLDMVGQLRPDIGVVVAYGKILAASLLAIPRHGFVNVHASILPQYRGAAPIQRAIEHGETETGVTIMRVDAELDHGPMLATAKAEIGPDERTPALSKRLSQAGATALLPVLDAIERGTAEDVEQDHAAATLAPKIEKQEGAIRWSDAGVAIYNRFRAFDPWPGVFFTVGGETVKATNIALGGGASGADPGTILRIDPSGVQIATGDGAIRAIELQRASRPRAAAAAVLRGLGLEAGDRLP